VSPLESLEPLIEPGNPAVMSGAVPTVLVAKCVRSSFSSARMAREERQYHERREQHADPERKARPHPSA